MTSTASSFRTHGMLRLALLVLGALLLQPALARKDDRSQPMRVVHADSFSGFNAPNSITTLNGHVELSQGTLRITGDLAKIYVDGNQQLSRIVVTGDANIQPPDEIGSASCREKVCKYV